MTFFIDLNKVTPIDNVVIVKDDDVINLNIEIEKLFNERKEYKKTVMDNHCCNPIHADIDITAYYNGNSLVEFNEYGKPVNYYGDLIFKFDLSWDKIEELDLYILDMNHNHYDRVQPIIEKLREMRDNEPLEFQEDLENITILKDNDEIIEFYLDLFFEPALTSEIKTNLINRGIVDVNVCLDYIKNDYAVYEHNDFTVIFTGE